MVCLWEISAQSVVNSVGSIQGVGECIAFMTIVTMPKRIKNLYKLIGIKQSIKFCIAYLRHQAAPIQLQIAGIDTPVLCRVRDSDIRVLWQVFGERWFNLPDIQPPQLIVDGGAYIGYTALFFAAHYPDAKIIAIEPNAENCELFRRNCAAYANIELIEAAVWDADVPLHIENPQDDSWMLRMEAGESAENPPVDGISLTTVLTESEFDAIDLLKLDIEGAEKVVFGRNYAQWLPRTRHMLIELHERYTPGCDDTFYAAIAEEPYQISEVGEYTILRRNAMWQVPQPAGHFL